MMSHTSLYLVQEAEKNQVKVMEEEKAEKTTMTYPSKITFKWEEVERINP